MGRRKIAIKPLQDDRNRSVTFLKRKAGLFKKAHELAVLCQIDIAVIILSPDQRKLYQFTSCDRNDLMDKCNKLDIQEHKTPYDFDKSLPRILIHSNTGKASSKGATSKGSAARTSIEVKARFSDEEPEDFDEDFDEEDTDAESVYSKRTDVYSPAESYAHSPEVKQARRSSASCTVLSKSPSSNNTTSPDVKTSRRTSTKRSVSASGNSIKSTPSTGSLRASRNSRSTDYPTNSLNENNRADNKIDEDSDKDEMNKNKKNNDDKNDVNNDSGDDNNGKRSNTEANEGQLDQNGSYSTNIPVVKPDRQLQLPHQSQLHHNIPPQPLQNLAHQQAAYAHMTPLNMHMPEQRNVTAFIGNPEYISSIYHNQRHKLQYSPVSHDIPQTGNSIIPRSLPSLINNSSESNINNNSSDGASQSSSLVSPRTQSEDFGGFHNPFNSGSSGNVYGDGNNGSAESLNSSLRRSSSTSAPLPATSIEPPVHSVDIKPSISVRPSTSSVSLMRPKLKVQIPIDKISQDDRNRNNTSNQSVPGSASGGTDSSGSAIGGISSILGNSNLPMGTGSNSNGNTVLLLPPPSPSSMLTGGSNGGPHSAGVGPGNPFARPNTVNMLSGAFNESTPFSPAAPSRYLHDLLPSPSSNFYGSDLFSFVPGSAGGMGGAANPNMVNNMTLANPTMTSGSTSSTSTLTTSSAQTRTNNSTIGGSAQLSAHGFPSQSLHNGGLNSATFNGQYSAGPISALGMFGMSYLGNNGMGIGGLGGGSQRGHLAIDMLPSPLQFNTPVVASSYHSFADPKASPSSSSLPKRSYSDDVSDLNSAKRVKGEK